MPVNLWFGGLGYRLSFDIGGTFTDLVIVDESSGESWVLKLPSTPRDPAQGVLIGLAKLLETTGIPAKEVVSAMHATTIVTNTVIERKGAKTALITTLGFRDVLEIGREKRVTIFDIFEERAEPLVPRRWRLEATERIGPDGEVVIPLDKTSARKLAKEIAANRIESVAICLLHSYANTTHETELEQILRNASPMLPISRSSSVLPEWREFDRTSTTVINAYAVPRTRRYMYEVESQLRALGYESRLFIMQSNGGLMAVDTAAEYPVRMIESGPAAGALAAAFYAKLSGMIDILSFDMGGTTAKCCLILDGEPRVTSDFEVTGYLGRKGGGYPVKTPTVDLVEIGAGGGSIAHAESGLLKVGPESAGADPGPACYPSGGERPTVTDADLVLGYLNPDYFLGGAMKISLEKAQAAIERLVCQPLALSLVDGAKGIHDVVNANMAQAMRVVSVERGEDPSRLTLFAFGGAGPVHAARIAVKLRIPRILIPLAAGATSAYGLLVADAKFDLVRTHMGGARELDLKKVSEIYGEMEAENASRLKELGVNKSDKIYSVDMRYVGQAFEVPVRFDTVGSLTPSLLEKAFARTYERYYGFTRPDPIECVSWRLTTFGRVSKPRLELTGQKARESGDPVKGFRKVYFEETAGFSETKILNRYALHKLMTLEGPMIIEEKESTAVVPPGWSATADQYGNLELRFRGR